MKISSAKWFRIPFAHGIAEIAEIDGRPFIAVNSLCAALDIPEATQERRLRRHALVNRMRVVHETLETGSQWTLVPLEMLAWFLWTLKPRSAAALATLQIWRETLPWQVAQNYVHASGKFGTVHALKETTAATTSCKHWSRGKKRSITAELIEHMRTLQQEGKTLGDIAKEVGYSKPTVCQCLRGVYPSVVPFGSTTGTDALRP